MMPSVMRTITGPAMLLGLLLAATATPAAPLNIIIGNGPDAPGDSYYLNAGNLANTMAFTSVLVVADNSITVAEPVDLSMNIVGDPTLYNLTLRAPTVTIGSTVTMGAGGFFMDAATVNLDAELQASDGSLLGASQLVEASQPTGPSVINVNGTGSVEQATTLGLGWSAPATLNLLGGAHPLENLTAIGALGVNMSGGSVGSASVGGGSAMDWSGGQILNGVLVFTGGALEIFGNGFQVAPAANCALLPESAWASAPAQFAGAGHCVRGLLADGSSFSTLINSDGTTHFDVVSAVPVPAAAWLLGSALAGLTGLTGLRRRR